MDFYQKYPPFLRKLITFVKQNTHDLAGIPAKAGSFPTMLFSITNLNGGLMVYSLDSHGDRTGSILAAAFGYTLVTTDLYGG